MKGKNMSEKKQMIVKAAEEALEEKPKNPNQDYIKPETILLLERKREWKKL